MNMYVAILGLGYPIKLQTAVRCDNYCGSGVNPGVLV